jgi:hypothetical protein
MDLPRPTASVGTRSDYSVGPWDYSICATRHLMPWGARTKVEKYSDRKLYNPILCRELLAVPDLYSLLKPTCNPASRAI